MAVNRAFSVRSFFLLLSLIILICEADGRSVGHFWHVTDFHYDHTYGTTGLSCNEEVDMSGYYGDYWCDPPWSLVVTSVNNMKALKADPDFIIWTGDSSAHIRNEDLTVQLKIEILQNVTDLLTDVFPNTPVYAVLGNHDFYPTHEARENDEEFFGKIANMWSHWINDSYQTELFKKGGYYYKDISPTLRLFGLNTNFYYSSNRLTANIPDPAGQYAWLMDQLTQTRTLGKKAIIIGHVTPGLQAPNLFTRMYSQDRERFSLILMAFSDIIVATHFGHDHTDGFNLIQVDDGWNAVLEFVAPSVTPWRWKSPTASGDPHNPGIRLYSYDRNTGDHLDYIQYYINLTVSNDNRKADWTKLYSFTEAYDVPDISVQSVKTVYSRMETLGSPYAQKYCQYAFVSDVPVYCPADYQAGNYCCGVHVWLDDAKRCKEQMIMNGGIRSEAAVHTIPRIIVYSAFFMCILLAGVNALV